MTTTWNADKPAVGNQISADIPDIEENFQLIGEIFTAITNATLGTTAAAAYEVDKIADACPMTSPVVTTGFNDGTQAISWPTNNMAAAKFMLGNSNTIAWFYLTTAPPGWKAIDTGADTVLAVTDDGVGDGGGEYDVAGGNQDSVNDWTTNWSYTLLEADIPAHTHTKGAATQINNSEGGGATRYIGADGGGNETASYGGGGAHDHGRPSASVGKLFQLDTA